MICINETTLAGVLVRQPELDAAAVTPHATGRLCLEEPGPDGRLFKTFLEIESWGKAAAPLAALHEGDVVLVRGRLWWRKLEERTGLLVVNAWGVYCLAAGAAQSVPADTYTVVSPGER